MYLLDVRGRWRERENEFFSDFFFWRKTLTDRYQDVCLQLIAGGWLGLSIWCMLSLLPGVFPSRLLAT